MPTPYVGKTTYGRTASEKRSQRLTVRMTADEESTLVRLAAARGISVGSVIRHLVREYGEAEAEARVHELEAQRSASWRLAGLDHAPRTLAEQRVVFDFEESLKGGTREMVNARVEERLSHVSRFADAS